jgi:hypothetical protein
MYQVLILTVLSPFFSSYFSFFVCVRQMGDVAFSPPETVRTTSTAPLASKRSGWPLSQLSPTKKEGATVINVSGSGVGASPSNHAQRHNNENSQGANEEAVTGGACVQRCEVKGLRLCCFDPRDAMLSGMSR